MVAWLLGLSVYLFWVSWAIGVRILLYLFWVPWVLFSFCSHFKGSVYLSASLMTTVSRFLLEIIEFLKTHREAPETSFAFRAQNEKPRPLSPLWAHPLQPFLLTLHCSLTCVSSRGVGVGRSCPKKPCAEERTVSWLFKILIWILFKGSPPWEGAETREIWKGRQTF